MSKKPKVIIRKCAEYDPDRIRGLVLDAIDEMGIEPHGRTLVKPNVVASGDLFKHAYTRPEFIEGVVGALKARGAAMTETKPPATERPDTARGVATVGRRARGAGG